MGILTILGAVFSSWRIYMLIGVAVAAALLFGYVEHLRGRAAVAEATVAVVSAVHQTDMNTITSLTTARAADEAALRSVASTADKLGQTISSIKDTINAIPEPKSCQGVDARDRAAIDGVRKLVAPSHPNADH